MEFKCGNVEFVMSVVFQGEPRVYRPQMSTTLSILDVPNCFRLLQLQEFTANLSEIWLYRDDMPAAELDS
jgi:hypothetical protein